MNGNSNHQRYNNQEVVKVSISRSFYFGFKYRFSWKKESYNAILATSIMHAFSSYSGTLPYSHRLEMGAWRPLGTEKVLAMQADNDVNRGESNSIRWRSSGGMLDLQNDVL